MIDNELLLLGLLQDRSQYGYEINEFIQTSLGRLTSLKKPTAYATLNRLHQAGYVTVRTEHLPSRLPRRIFTITTAGQHRFDELLRQRLASVPLLESTTDVGMLFVDRLPPSEARALLEQRLAGLDEIITRHERASEHDFPFTVRLGLDQYLHLLRANREWLAKVISDLAPRKDSS